MRFLIAIETSETYWNITVSCPGLDAAWKRERQMAKREDTGGWHFPLPLNPPASHDVHYDLCIPDHTDVRRNSYNSIVNRQAANVVEKFGRYLFESLVGGDCWQAIIAEAEKANAPFIELALRWANAEKSLHRLPWEMMHGPGGFLAQGHTLANGRLIEVAITRIVAGANFNSRQLSLPPRLLFVMGTAPDDPAIRPAAEIMGLLRQLKVRGRGVYSREISQATPSKLQNMIKEFCPDLVHFICHGSVERDTDRGYLEMIPDTLGDANRQFADQLIPNLRGKDGLPAIVVLSACYSAGVSAGKMLASGDIAPLAAELVAGGVPVVVGMSGRVSDHACRLFTRRFGDAILNGEPLIPATSQGRRTIFVEGHSAYASVDWAFPTIFLSEQVSSDYKPVPSLQTVPTVIVDQRITTYDVARDPIFCGRNEFFEDYYKLLSIDEPTTFERRFSEKKPAVLAIYGDDGFGKTRVLEEFTAQAIRDGHLPIALIVKGGVAEPPRDIDALREKLGDAIERACLAFGLNLPPAAKLQQPLQQTTARALKQALQADLAYVLEQAAERVPTMKVIVLLDEVQQYHGAFLRDLFDWSKNLLGNYGLGSITQPIPLVLAFSRSGPADLILKAVLEKPPTWLKSRQLAPFSDKGEDLLAYGRVLLHPFAHGVSPGYSDKSWAFNDQSEVEIVSKHQGKFRRHLKGIPAKLTDDVFFVLAEGAVEDKYLIEADDNRLLDLARGVI